ncbi:hypothetical protein ABPG75_008992 [Micractinium tetrahymenae]
MAMDLPDWTQGLAEQGFDCSPPKQPLAQVTLKDGNTLRVSALSRQGVSAAAAAPLPVPAFTHVFETAPAAPPAPPEAGAANETGDDSSAAAAEPPRSAARRTHTPSRTGLTARAVRLPSRLGLTPGAKQPEQFAVPASAAVAGLAPATTGGNLKSILKRLNFSTTKGRAAAAPAAGDGSAAALPIVQRQPATAVAAESTIKQLRFDMGATPAASTAARPAAAGRHVSFGAGTVSPAARVRPARPSAAAGTPAWRTPQPTILEDDSAGSSGSEGGGTPGAGSVNSAAAGHTPYDRRLSSLVRKYQVAGTPELPDAELDEFVAGGAVRSPSWNRLSSASVPESIRELAKKYTSDAAPSPTATPAAAAVSPAPEGTDAGTPVQAGGEGRSPTLDPTPHHLLDGIMQRNELYESPPAGQGQGPAEAAAAQGGAPAPASSAAPPAAEPAAKQPAATSGQLSPASTVAQLLGPVLRLTLEEIEAEKAAGGADEQPAAAEPARAGPSPGGSLASPADFYGFPSLATPGGSSPRTNSSSVPRDSEGVPLVTPATVTVRRGSSYGGRGDVPEDDALAANLFCATFSPGDSVGGAAASTGSPGGQEEVLEFGGFAPAAASQPEPEAGGREEQEAATPAAGADACGDFSFFPTVAAAAPASGPRSAGITPGMTPELAGAGGAAAGSTISPEILGFYEQQAQQAAAAAACAPALPRSIIKSGRPLNEAGTPVLGHAQRALPGQGEAAPPPTITRELQALMADLRLEDASEIEQMGTVSTLSPVRTTGALRGLLGGLARAITPVRRSARKRASSKPLEAMLEETDYSYVPNAALMAEDAPPKVEAAEAKAARKAASQAASQASAEPSAAGGRAEHGQPEVCSTARADEGAAEQGGQGAPAAATPAEELTPVGRQLSLRRLRTPKTQAGAAAGEAATPAPGIPVPQDSSPQLAESPGFGGIGAAANSAAANATPRSYSFRPSTLKKTRQSLGGTPLHKENSGTPPAALSPTEQSIRSSLRRSARKSRGPK